MFHYYRNVHADLIVTPPHEMDSARPSTFLTCATTWLSLLSVWCLIGATHWGQPWTPALTLPHVRYGLRVLRMAVLCTFSMPSRCRHGHRQ
jgi:hypothetical protein